ncbi:hypothetical protein NGUA03_01766 [Salmonella enterica]|nr:hypothetical protein NGUA03_01766 [Salmonella enterica]
MNASARADIDNVVSGANRIFIVLDHNHGITQITQMDERAQQTFVIALMQTNRRFIQDVHHADQTRADLARQANTLGFAAGERFR